MSNAKIVIRKNKELNDGSFPLAIRMAHLNHPSKYIQIKGMSCSEEEWNTELCRFTRKKENYKALNLELTNKEKLIDSIVEVLDSSGSFSYQNFMNRYLGIMEDLIQKRIKEELRYRFKLFIVELAELSKTKKKINYPEAEP